MNFSGFALVPEQGAIRRKGSSIPICSSASGDGRAHRPERQRRRDGLRRAGAEGKWARFRISRSSRCSGRISSRWKRDADAGRADQGLLVHGAGQRGFFSPGVRRRGAARQVQAAYEKAIPKINACADEMTDRRVALMRDSALLDRLYSWRAQRGALPRAVLADRRRRRSRCAGRAPGRKTRRTSPEWSGACRICASRRSPRILSSPRRFAPFRPATRRPAPAYGPRWK